MTLKFFWNDVSKTRKKSSAKVWSSIHHQGVITSLNDHCNSIPSSQEQSLNNRKRNRLTEARARDLVYVHSNLKLLQKLQLLDYQEANVEWERWAVSDSDSSEEKQ